MRRRVMRDGGAGMIEYAGLIVLAALVLAALVSILPGSVSDGVSRAVCEVFQSQNCAPARSGGRPSAQGPPTRTNYNVPSRFANGFFRGLGDTLGVSRASIPVDPSTDPGKVWPGAGGPSQNNTVDHNIIVYDTAALIEQEKDQYVDDGVVTIDCGPAGHAANCIPGGGKNGKGGTGYADIILTGKDKETGEPITYIWEVKKSTQAGESEIQLSRYIKERRRQNPGSDVRKGFPLRERTGIPGSGGNNLWAWSPETRIIKRPSPYKGIRFYREQKRPDRRTQEQPQKQPQEEPNPYLRPDYCPERITGVFSCVPYAPGQPPLPDLNPGPGKAPGWRFPLRWPILEPAFP